MKNYENKKDKALEKIVETVSNLDNTLSKIDSSNNRFESWVEQKKAIFEIKRILHSVDKLDSYNEKEYDQFIAEIDQ